MASSTLELNSLAAAPVGLISKANLGFDAGFLAKSSTTSAMFCNCFAGSKNFSDFIFSGSQPATDTEPGL